MKLFISFSGETSHQIAQNVRNFLTLILPAVKPFLTSADVDKGARWAGEISRELGQSNYGIICLTADNLQSQWLAFEAGALAKQVEARAATLLFGLNHEQVPYPLKMFQGTLFNKADVRQLVGTLTMPLLQNSEGKRNSLTLYSRCCGPTLNNKSTLFFKLHKRPPRYRN
jgi:TIR domain